MKQQAGTGSGWTRALALGAATALAAVTALVSLGVPVAQAEGEAPAATLAVSQQPQQADAAKDAEASFAAATTGGVAPVTVQWQRSTALHATTVPPSFTNLTAANTLEDSFAKPTLKIRAGDGVNVNNRWYRAVFTDADGATVTTQAARLAIVPAPTVTAHPNTIGQTINEGGTATFSAAASSPVDFAVAWQSTRTRLPNGEPDGETWAAVAGATSPTLTVTGTDSDTQHGTFYRAAFSNVSGTTYSHPAELRFFDKLDATRAVTVSGESYGPVQPNTPFSVSAPNAVVKGKPIVITGSGYLATDGTTGSVANFMVDASYSGDPNTLNTTREIINPVTGQVFADKRSHGIVQAKADGTWRIEIPWPSPDNTVRDAAFFATNWKAGTQHIVRILTGSLLTNPADYQRGISVRFTIVDEPVKPSAPVATANPSITGTPVVGGTLTAKPGTWSVAGLTFGYQWLRDGAAISGATKASYQVASADAGKNLQVRVTASKTGLPNGAATSAAVKAGKALTKTPTPTISGTAKVGKTLKAKAGSWKPSKVTLKYQWLRDGQPIAKATKSSYKLTKADTGRKVSVRVTGSKTGYVSVAKTSKAKSVAKVKATVKLSVPSKVAKGKQATAKLTVTGAVSNPTGNVTLTVNGKKLSAVLAAAGKGKVSITLPAIGKKGSYQVKASFSPTGETAVSTSKSSTVTKKLKVR